MDKAVDKKKKKKKKGFVQKMMFGNDDKPDLTPEQMNMSKWGMFKYLFFNRFGTMVALNILTVLFAIPAIIVIILFYSNITINNGYIPYSSNLGIGYPVIINAASMGNMMSFTYTVYEFALLIPCIAIFALGVSGNLYVMRKLVWEEPTRTIRDFFKGIKKTWLQSVFMGMFYGLTLLLFQFSLGYADAYGLSTAIKVVMIVFTSLLLLFMTIFAAFLLTQNAAFKMKGMVLIRNSLLFVGGTHIMSVVFVLLAVAPVFLMFIPGITMLLCILYFFIGFSYTTLVVTLYCHYCYERFLYDKVDDMPSAVYSKRVNDIYDDKSDSADKAAGKGKKAPVPYKNPKKRKRSIDDGATITPLMPTFRREDLERIEREHAEILNESITREDEPAEDTAPPAAEPDTKAEDVNVRETDVPDTAAAGTGVDAPDKEDK